MANITDKFFELIQISLGNKAGFEQAPSEKEWSHLFDLSCMQSLTSVLLEGLEIVEPSSRYISQDVFFEWIGARLNTEPTYKLQRERAKVLCRYFSNAGYRNCILKGLGTSLYYKHPEQRQCGDIDIWVTKDGRCKTDDVRSDVLQFAKSQGYHIGHIDIKHSDIDFFKDVPVEVHFLPSWMYNPSTNRKLQRFFKEQSERQFSNYDAEAGFTHTTVEFDLVFSMVHIYRHIFSEGIGLRQLMDYYFILQGSFVNQRKDAFAVLRSLKMSSFVGGIMWILKECFGMKEEYLLCAVNERHGEFLLSEIMTAGNFGQYDARTTRIDVEKRFARGFVQFKRNWRFVRYYPSEVLWSPFWKLWHWCWRKRKGYL